MRHDTSPSDPGVAFVPRTEPPGVGVEDRVSGRQYAVNTPDAVSPTPVDADALDAPVAAAVAVTTASLRIPDPYAAYVRDPDGDLVAAAGDDPVAAGAGSRVELGTPVKTYLRVDAPFDCRVTASAVVVDLDAPARVVVAARPYRVAPTATIEVADDPRSLLSALSYFGSALGSLSPERSFPSLRGHPPALRVGDALDVPPDLARPASGVVVEAPPTLGAAYAVAPLAYYLAADVVPGDALGVRTDARAHVPTVDGAPATDAAGVATAVERLLTHCLTLDCLVRTVGRYPVDLDARRAFESAASVDLDYEALYDAPLPARTARYLDVPRDPVAAVAPRWPLAAVVDPGPTATETLSPLVDRFALVRPGDPPRYSGDAARAVAFDTFAGAAGARSPLAGSSPPPSASASGTDDPAVPTRSASLVFADRESYVDLPGTGADRQMWVGDGIPLGASASHPAGFAHRNRRASASARAPPLRIDVVSNEASMDEEVEASIDAYGVRADRDVETTIHRRLSTTALREVIAADTDFLHFVGHATADGLVCTDGSLDVSSVDDPGVDAFCLNACESYRQGEALVERGSVGGVVTHSRVADPVAVDAGVAVARLLSCGWPLGAALALLTATNAGGQYTAIGDESVCLAQPGGGPPFVRIVSTDPADGYDLRLRSAVASACRWGVGSLVHYDVGPPGRQHLVSTETGPRRLSGADLREFCALGDGPILLDGDLRFDLPDAIG